MPAEVVDREKVVGALLRAAAPERATELAEIWSVCDPTFILLDDAAGFQFWTRGTRVEFSAKATDVVWLLSFAAWGVVRCISPLIFLSKGSFNEKLLAADEGFDAARAEFESILHTVRAMLLAPDRNDVPWPPGVPLPQASSDGLSEEDHAVFDLSCLAMSYILLHEICHARFSKAGNRPADPAEEEMGCDVFARDFLLAKAGTYATDAGYEYRQVVNRRGIGLAIGIYVLYYITPRYDLGGTVDYPPIADRFTALIGNMSLAPDRSFFIVANALLVSILKDAGSSLPEPGNDAKAYFDLLLSEIRRTTNSA